VNRTLQHPPNFRQSIQMLAERAGSVPSGWRKAFDDTLVKLSAVDCPARSSTLLSGPFVNDISLSIVAKGQDSVVSGIARCLSARTEQTCERCGRAGRLRTLATRQVAVLCPKCAAPRILNAELTQLLREVALADSALLPRIWSYDQLAFQVRPVIPGEVWRTGLVAPGTTKTHFVSDAALRRLKPTLELLQRKLATLLAEDEPA